jgi:hypothetical protein
MTKRADIAARLPRLGALPLYEAAAYCALSVNGFRDAQEAGEMPLGRVIGGKVIYRVADLDAALAALDFANLPSSQDQGASKPEVVL